LGQLHAAAAETFGTGLEALTRDQAESLARKLDRAVSRGGVQ
jgi:hypothetical protein